MILWFVWETEYPEEGSIVVEADDEAGAIAAYRALTDADADGTARRVTANDVEALREMIAPVAGPRRRTQAERDVLRERAKQRDKYAPWHDNARKPGELAAAAAAVAIGTAIPRAMRDAPGPGSPEWADHLLLRPERERHVIAAALLLAELDRAERMST